MTTPMKYVGADDGVDDVVDDGGDDSDTESNAAKINYKGNHLSPG